MYLTNQKTIAQIVVTDRSACSYVRWRNWAHVMNSTDGGVCEFVVTTTPIFDEQFLARCAVVVFARVINDEQAYILGKFAKLKKKFGFTLALDYDDLLFDLQGRATIPSYNIFSDKADSFAIGKVMERAVRFADRIFVSTAFLQVAFTVRFGMDVAGKLHILKNYVSESMFFDIHDEHLECQPLRVMYTGAVNHFRDNDPGDLAGPWMPAMERLVRDGKIMFFAFGSPNPFMPKRTEYLPFVSSAMWPYTLSQLRPDVIIGPLKDNPFNRSKSDLKLLESSAIGAAFVGSAFNDSPYNDMVESCKVSKTTTADDLYEIIDGLTDPKIMDEVTDEQRLKLTEGHRIMEDEAAKDCFISTVFGDFIVKS